MKNIVVDLWTLQGLLFRHGKPVADRDSKVESLRQQVPDSVLGVFNRWVLRGKRPVASVTNGACNECHLRLTVATLGALAFGQGLQVCSNCGRYLYLPENEPVFSEKPAAKPRPAQRNKEAPVHVS